MRIRIRLTDRPVLRDQAWRLKTDEVNKQEKKGGDEKGTDKEEMPVNRTDIWTCDIRWQDGCSLNERQN